MASVNGAPTFVWTHYTTSFTANITEPYLYFEFVNDNQRQWWLDDVSVVDATAGSGNLLSNPSFENSSTTVTGWNRQLGCCNTNALNINTTGCFAGSNCINFYCGPENTYGIIGQNFTAIVGHTYNISYYLKTSGTGGKPTFCDVGIFY